MNITILKQEDLINLRSKVLRPNAPRQECYFEGDNDPGVIHLGIRSEGEILSICSLYPEKSPAIDTQNQYRLRGMATDAQYQAMGLGEIILRESLKRLKELGVNTLWCNARTSALGFYKKQGFKVSGEEFDIPSVGPHFLAYIDL